MTTVRRTQPQATPAAKPATTKSRVTRVAKAPPAGPPSAASSGSAKAALRGAFATNRRTALTRDAWLRSQRPFAVEVDLPRRGALVLMKRIDLLDLAREFGEYTPLRSRLVSILQAGGLKKDKHLGDDSVLDTLALARAVTKATIIVPPAAWAAACEADYETLEAAKEARDAAIADMTRADLRPQFVDAGEPMDEDQLVLAGGEGGDGDDEAVVIHEEDLITILASAYVFGPGALGRRFRGEPEPKKDAMAALRELARKLEDTKPAA